MGLRFENMSPKCVGLEANGKGFANVFSIEGCLGFGGVALGLVVGIDGFETNCFASF